MKRLAQMLRAPVDAGAPAGVADAIAAAAAALDAARAELATVHDHLHDADSIYYAAT